MKKSKKIQLTLSYEDLEQHDSAQGDFVFERYENYVRAIGQFIIAFSRLEASVDVCTADLIYDGAHDPGYRILKYLKFKDKCGFLGDEFKPLISFALREKDKGKFRNRLDKLLSELASMAEFRNKVAHANWMSLDKEGYVRVKIDISEDGTGVLFKKIKVTPAILQKFTRRCYALANEVENFKEQLNTVRL